MSHLQPSSGVLLSCVEEEDAEGNAPSTAVELQHCPGDVALKHF